LIDYGPNYWKLRNIIDLRANEVSRHFGATREQILTPSTGKWVIEKVIEDLKQIYGDKNYVYVLRDVNTICTER